MLDVISTGSSQLYDRAAQNLAGLQGCTRPDFASRIFPFLVSSLFPPILFVLALPHFSQKP